MLAALINAAFLVFTASAAEAADEDSRLTMSRSDSGYYLIDVNINGAGIWPFLVDTGSSHTSLSQPLAEELGFISTHEILYPVQTLTAEIEAERYLIGNVRLGGLTVDTPLYTVIIPVPENSSARFFGLLGADAFENRVISLDLRASSLDLGAAPPRHADGMLHPDKRVPVTAAVTRRHRAPIHVLVDTGAPRTIVNSVLAQRLSHHTQRRRASRINVASISPDAPALEDGRLVTVPDLMVGGVCIGSMLAVRADADIFRALGWENEPAMVLGLDVLQHAVITLDYSTGAMEISPARREHGCRGRRAQFEPEMLGG